MSNVIESLVTPLGHVPIHISKWVPKNYFRVVGDKVVAGSPEVVERFVKWVNAHQVLTSPPSWMTDDGRIVDEMPEPGPEVDIFRGSLTGGGRA